MKSFCIKTNNQDIIDYLLNRIEKVDFNDIYYCNKEFKIYKNVFVHYIGKDMAGFINFITDLISNTIINFYEDKILKQMINSNYFYFDDYEKKKIMTNCKEYEKIESLNKKEKLYNEIEEYIKLSKKQIVLDGIVNFRIKEYKKELDNIVDMAVNQYIIEKEYIEFINLLKIYVNTTPITKGTLHLIYMNGESILLDEEKNIVSLSDNIYNAKYLSDITFSSNDFALNTLLSMIPRKLEIHIIDEEDEFINTLKLIFEDRISICKECNICKTYKIINNMKILN